jgi:hypothetical protein
MIKAIGHSAHHSLGNLNPFEFERARSRATIADRSALLQRMPLEHRSGQERMVENRIPVSAGPRAAGSVTKVAAEATRHAAGDLVPRKTLY